MKPEKKKRLEAARWKVGTVQNRHARTCPATTRTGHQFLMNLVDYDRSGERNEIKFWSRAARL
jgi:hypothetical protein